MSANQQPVPPIVADFVVAPYIDPLPKLRRNLAGVKESTNAVLAAIRHQARNPKRDRPAEEDESNAAVEAKPEQDFSTVAYALHPATRMSFSIGTAELHAEVLSTVAEQFKNAVAAERKERPKAIKRIDEWAAKSADGFNISNSTHVAALAWFKDNLAFEHVLDGEDYETREGATLSPYLRVATLASTVRIASFGEVHERKGVSIRWCKAAPATGVPPHYGTFMGQYCIDGHLPNWEGVAVGSSEFPPVPAWVLSDCSDAEEENNNQDVVALLPAVCPLRDLPATAVVRLFEITTLLTDLVGRETVASSRASSSY